MWLRPQGYAEITSDGTTSADLDHLQKVSLQNGKNGFDTCSCGHCNRIFHVGARQRPEDIGGMCPQCWKPICPHCLDKGCTPLEKAIEEQEERTRTLLSYGL